MQTSISTQHLERKGIISLDILPLLKDKTKKTEYMTIDDVIVKITSQRYTVFQESTICYICGAIGSYFALEKPKDTPKQIFKSYHLNLYGIKDGVEILFTKDHVLAKSNGGKNHKSNYKTCCEPCNKEKSNKL